MAGKFYYDRKKKSSSRLSGGLCCCVSFWFWRLQPEKKVLFVCLAGCAVDQFLVLVITTGKKKLLSSVWRVVLCNEFVLVLVKIDLIHFEH